jgi:hypothetical protein
MANTGGKRLIPASTDRTHDNNWRPTTSSRSTGRALHFDP